MHPLPSLLAIALAQLVIAQQPVTPEQKVTSGQPACPVVLPVPAGLTQRVLGGQSVQHDDLLFHALLFHEGATERGLCSAARLSKHWVLTAAHCDVNPWWNVSLSAASIWEPGVPARIERVYKHPNYTALEPDPFDVALLRIVPAASERDDVHVLRVNSAPSLPVDGAFVRASGYGRLSSGVITISNGSHLLGGNFGDLHFVDMPVFPFISCSQAYPGLSKKHHLCSGYRHNSCTTCRGDSGGPEYQYDKQGRAVQVAVHSGSMGCAEPEYPAVGVRVDALLPWFKEVGAVFEIGEPGQVFRQSNIAEGSDTAQGDVSQPSASAALVGDGAAGSDDGVSALDVQQSRAGAGSRWAVVGISLGLAFGALCCVGEWVLVARKRMNKKTPHAPAA